MDETAPATLQELLAGLDRFAGAPAVVAFDAAGEREHIAYDILRARSLALAGGLIARGLAPATPAVLFAPNSVAWIVCRLALIAVDALCVPIDVDADAERLASLLRGSKARVVFTVSALLETAEAARRDLQNPPAIVLLEGRAGGPDLPTLDTIAAGAPATLPRADPDAPAAEFYTSGTTGPPKAVRLSHRNILTNARVLHDLGVLRQGDRVALPLPLHHSYPFIVGLVLPLLAGATVVLPAGITGPHLLRALKEGGATILVGVPRLYEAMAAAIDTRLREGAPAVALRPLRAVSTFLRRRFGLRAGRILLAPLHRRLAPRLRTLVSGGARLEAATEWRLESLGWRVLTGYGLVETASVATFNRPDDSRIGSAGKPSPAVEMRLQPVDGLADAEIQFRGPIVFDGYRDNPDTNATAFTADGWFRTGDLGRVDTDGFLFVTGRSKEMIVLPDGKNVAPEEVEAVYGRSRFVREIAVIESGGRLAAIVVPDMAAAGSADTGRLRDELRISFGELGSRLPRYMRIADFVVVRGPLPRNQLGKYLRHRLPEIYAGARRDDGRTARPPNEAERARMARPRSAAALAWLAGRFPGRPIGLGSVLQIDLDIDSLAWVDLSLDIERRLGLGLDENTIAGLVTVGDLLEAIERAPAARGRPVTARPDTWEAAEPGVTARLFVRLLHTIAAAIAHAFFRLTVEGGAALPDGPVVVAANHESDLDPLILIAALRRTDRRRVWWGVDARRVFGVRAIRSIAGALKVFPVDDHAPAASIERAVAVLSRGRALIWFPEEWRSPDGELLPFRSGIGAIVAQSGATVVPAHVEGTFEALPRTAHWPRLHRVRVRFGPPLAAAALTAGAEAEGRALHRAIAARIQEAVAALTDDPER